MCYFGCQKIRLLRAPYFLGAPLALALSPSKSAARFALSKKIVAEKNGQFFFSKLPNGSFAANIPIWWVPGPKLVQYHKGYFGPPTQFSPYIACFSFLTQGLLNFESANKINDCRSQRSTFFWERRSAIVCKKSEAKNCKNHNFTVWRMVSDHFFLLQHPLRGRSRPRPQSDLRGRLRPRPQIRPPRGASEASGRGGLPEASQVVTEGDGLRVM